VLEWKIIRKINGLLENEGGKWRIRTTEEIDLLV
jgi:hypothetical protein